MQDQDLITVQDAVKLYPLNENRFYKLAYSGRLDSKIPPRRPQILVSKKSIEAHLAIPRRPRKKTGS